MCGCDAKRGALFRWDGDGNGSSRGNPKRRWSDMVRDDIREKGLSGEDVYTHATWRCISSNIDPTNKHGTKMRRSPKNVT